MNPRARITDLYGPLVKNFAAGLDPLAYANLPELFLPQFGKGYAEDPNRLLIIGKETKGYGDMSSFIKSAQEKPEKALFRNLPSFQERAFRKWTNNFGRSFWDFNLKVLAAQHELDWKELKRDTQPEILERIAWGNTHCLEDYKVSAQKRGGTREAWQEVKERSRRIDSLAFLVAALKPKRLLILNWAFSHREIKKLDQNYRFQQHGPYLQEYELPQHDLKVVKTAHPTFIARSKSMRFDEQVKKVAQLLK